MRLAIHASLSERTAIANLTVTKLVLIGGVVGTLVVRVAIGVTTAVLGVRLLVHCCSWGRGRGLAHRGSWCVVTRSRGITIARLTK